MIVTQPSKYCEHLFHNISSSKLWLEGLDVVPAATDAGASVSIKKITLDKNLEKALYQLKKVLKVPINILFQTAWGILLNRFSGTNNIFYGIQFSGNERILPMRSKLREVDDILTYIVKLYKQQKKNKKHADEILTKLDNQEKYKNLLHYIILFHDDKDNSIALNAYPFILKVTAKTKIDLEFIYNPKKFTEESIQNLIDHYVQILLKITQDSHQSVTHFSILTPNEKKTLLNEWNTSSYPPPSIHVSQLIHEKVKWHAEKDPKKIAIVFNNISLTYQELNDLSDQLAVFLLEKGIQSQSVVAVLMERTPALIVTLLAIFKVGAIYVPINLKYPEDRIKYILNDCQANLFIANDKKHIPAEFINKTYLVDDKYELLSYVSNKKISPNTHLENIAYIMYTSGTTGYPKGVMIKQISLINLSQWYEICFELSKDDKVSQFASQAFDSYFCETMPALFCGASIHIIDDHKKLIPDEFLSWLKAEQITICDLPTAYALIILNLSIHHLSLRHLKLGGEGLSHYPEKSFHFNIWNTYGPTEATVETTYIKIYDPLIGITHTQVPPPIGKPLINAEVYVVDKYLQLVPIGNVGELLIGGLGVSSGYLNRSELTKEKFINNYYSDSQTKLYRTGDLVRWLADGNLEFVGRLDHQVKIRGYRIELNEIKLMIEQYPDVSEVVVLVKELPNSQKTLAAYLVHDLDKIRIPYQQKCLISINNQQYKEIFSDDISKHGVAVNGLQEKLTIGQPVRINILLPGYSDTCWLEGTVIWQMNERAGIQFNDTPAQNEMLANIIEYFLSDHNLMETLQNVASNRNLRDALKKKLPDYMIPSSFTVMPKFPLTFNGKIDWKALPPPRNFEDLLERDYVPPRSETEKIVTDIWKDILNLKKISMNDNFFDLGGNSLQVSELSVKILERFQISIPVKIYIDLPFIPIISEYIDSKGKSYTDTSSVQNIINHDAILNEDILPTMKLKENLKDPKNILLTGVSGFLGIHLLKEFLATTHATIYCLIRKTERVDILQRFLSNVKRYKIENDISMPNPRVILLEGDVGLTQFGLTVKQYNDLAEEIDIICHCAAQVNMIASYSTLRASNVLGTIEVIKFATHLIDKPIHYISTLSAAHQKDKYGQFTEEFPNANSSNLVGGYAVSKWISERLLTEIKNRGLPVSIYRCGYILGRTDSGIVNINEALLFLIKGCIQLGFAPEWSQKITFLPVDFVSQTIVKILLNFPTNSEVYNLDHPSGISWIDLITWLNDYGYEIKLGSHEEWLEKLIHITQENALYSLLPQYLAEATETKNPESSMRNTLKAFQQVGLTFPKLDDQLLRIYMRFLREAGFVPDPYKEKA